MNHSTNEKKNTNWFDGSAYDGVCSMTPETYIDRMFARTESGGTLIVPDWSDEGPHHFERWLVCRMCWTEAERDGAKTLYQTISDALSEIAKVYKRLSDDEGENAKVLSPALLEDWRRYVAAPDMRDFDVRRIRDIRERAEIIERYQQTKMHKKLGLPLTKAGEAFMSENADVRLEPGEFDLLDAYETRTEAIAFERVGEGPMAETLLRCTKELCRMTAQHAPDLCIRYGRIRLAQALTLHTIAASVDRVALA